MWSGPRNLSTALMRSFGARPDCTVIDEPFYAAYLALTGRAHPMRAEVLAAGPTDPSAAEAALLAPAPTPVFFQKHMVQHMVPGIPRAWFSACRHAVLIRHPARALASFADRIEDATAEDLGIGATEAILSEIRTRTGQAPPIIEAEDIRANPGPMLQALCAALDIPYTPAMLSWPAGIHETDGIWAAHWYKTVAASTGFAPAAGPVPALPAPLGAIAEKLQPAFNRLQSQKLSA